jgi:hypothetical protein
MTGSAVVRDGGTGLGIIFGPCDRGRENRRNVAVMMVGTLAMSNPVARASRPIQSGSYGGFAGPSLPYSFRVTSSVPPSLTAAAWLFLSTDGLSCFQQVKASRGRRRPVVVSLRMAFDIGSHQHVPISPALFGAGAAASHANVRLWHFSEVAPNLAFVGGEIQT